MDTPDKNIVDYLKASKKPILEENFFSQFESQMLETLERETKKSKIRKVIFWSAGVAASIVVLISIALFTNISESLQTISKNEILAYVEDHLEDFDTESLADGTYIIEIEIEKDGTLPAIDLVEDETKTKEKIELEIPITFQDLEIDEIYNYLENEEINLEDL